MDMATYFSTFRGVPHSAAEMVAPFVHLLPDVLMAAPAVGLTEMPGHVNASCGGWPQCTNFSNPACGCLDYGWNETAFATFVRAAEAAGVTEIDVRCRFLVSCALETPKCISFAPAICFLCAYLTASCSSIYHHHLLRLRLRFRHIRGHCQHSHCVTVSLHSTCGNPRAVPLPRPQSHVTYTRARARTHAHSHTPQPPPLPPGMHARARAHTHTHMHTCTHTHMHTHARTRAHTHMHTHARTHIRGHTRAHVNGAQVWRQDMTPPPGTIPNIPPWLIAELTGFLARGL